MLVLCNVYITLLRTKYINFKHVRQVKKAWEGRVFLVRVLRDTTVSGRDRKWGVKKAKSRLLAQRYKEIKSVSDATWERVKSCGDLLEFAVDSRGRKRLEKAYFCKDRFCALCAWRRQLKMSYQTGKVLEASLQEEPGLQFLFATFTVKNCLGSELKAQLKQMHEAFRRMTNYKKLKTEVLGVVKSAEVTVNREDGTYHPHLHCIIGVRSNYVKGGHYISLDGWRSMWQKAMALDYKPMVSVKRVYSKDGEKSALQSGLHEVMKYQVKATDYLSEDDAGDRKIIETLRTELKGSRMVAYYGLFKEKRKELFGGDTVEEGDLRKVDDGVAFGEKVATILAEYDSHFKNYVVVKSVGTVRTFEN